MCGIAGILSSQPIDLRPIQAMTEIQLHRGPDNGALMFVTAHKPYRQSSSTPLPQPIEGTLALGHRRLAIIDTSDHGIQPMQSTASGCWICFNGEIYNYRELRTELVQQGCHFETETDTEVALRAYEQWGINCFSRFWGMWAMAIFDAKENQLILSRDRFGIKPLHYNIQNGRIAFASEIKALLTLSDIPRIANLSAIKSYLTQQLVNHSEETFFQNIHAFPPAHYAIIDLASPAQISPIAYWSLCTPTQNITYDNAQKQFRNLFDSAIAQHMRSDVPVGSCLSGGLDSSAIVCAANGLLPDEQKPFRTFTAIFDDKDINETPWVEDVNRNISAKPHWITPDSDGLLNEIDALIWHQDEPFTSTSMYAQWCVMREAQKAKVPVLLDGQGADEIMCGYKKFYLQHIKILWKKRHIVEAIRETCALLTRGDRTLFKLRNATRYLPKCARDDIKALNTLATDKLLRSRPINTPGLINASSVSERQIQDLQIFSLPSLLRFEDRNSMAFSIESRVPFLDHRLVEFCLSLPEHMKMHRGISKRIMRHALKDLIPSSILNRRDKMGFGAPEKRWILETLIPQFLRDIEADHFAIDAIISKTALRTLLNDASKTLRPSVTRLIFQIFVLNRWTHRFKVDFATE